MSSYQDLSKEALETIEKGSGDVKGYKIGSQSYLLALELALWKGPLMTDDRKVLIEKHGISKGTFKNILGRMRKLDLWSDATGGLGRTVIATPDVTDIEKEGDGEDVDVNKVPIKLLKVPVEGDGTRPVTLPKSVIGDGGKDVEVPGDGDRVPGEMPGSALTGQLGALFKRFDNMESELKILRGIKTPEGDGGNGVKDAHAPATPEEVRQMLLEMKPGERERWIRRKPGAMGGEDPLLLAFQYMEGDMPVVDVMEALGLTFEKAKDYAEKYNMVKAIELERQELTEPYLKAWFDMGRMFGENVRRYCSKYHEVNGVCEQWHMEDLKKSYRDMFRGLYRSAKKAGGGFFINVDKHPEMCAVCPVGMSQFMEEMVSERYESET